MIILLYIPGFIVGIFVVFVTAISGTLAKKRCEIIISIKIVSNALRVEAVLSVRKLHTINLLRYEIVNCAR